VADLATTRTAVRGSVATYAATFTDEDTGDIVAPGATTITLTSASGSVVQAATPMAAESDDTLSFALTTTHTQNLDKLTATLTTANLGTYSATLDIVGRHLFSIAEARSYHDNALADTDKFTTSAIMEARDRITEEFEQIAGVSFVPRYEYVTQNSALLDSSRLLLYKSNGDPALRVTSIRSVDARTIGTSTWAAFTVDELAGLYVTDAGLLVRETGGHWLYGYDNTRIGFEHGYVTPPLPIKTAALKLARYLVVPSNANSRALTETTTFGTVQLATAGRYGDHYGIPDVDSVLDRYTDRVPVVR